MKSRGRKDDGSKQAITRIWLGLAEESIVRLTGDRDQTDAPAVQKALDRAVEWTVGFLRQRDITVRTGRDGAMRTLEFDDEVACLEAHDTLLAANDHQREFTFHFVLRPSGVTILVIS
jgi:hypothetical protein